jgi:nucleoside 2-deoxyribosyltransferase
MKYLHNQYVYLAGPIEGISLEEATAWRQYASSYLRGCNIDTLDPTRRMSYHDQQAKDYAAARIVRQDLQDIANSSVLLVNLSDKTPGRKWGTVSEVTAAAFSGKIIITYVEREQFKHPFIEHFSTEIHHSLEDALRAVTAYFG